MLCLHDSIRHDDPAVQRLLRAVEDAPSLTAVQKTDWQHVTHWRACQNVQHSAYDGVPRKANNFNGEYGGIPQVKNNVFTTSFLLIN